MQPGIINPYLSRALLRTMNQYPSAPRVQRPLKKWKCSSSVVDDETVKSIIRRVHAGEKMTSLSVEFKQKYQTLRQWVDGTTRSHLLRDVENEERKASK